MAEDETVERAREDARGGKSPSTQAGEFVREEIRHIREGKHGAVSPQQAIAIGLSKARRAGVKLPAPKGSSEIRRKALQDLRKGRSRRRKVSRKRSRAVLGVLKRDSRSVASRSALSRQARATAKKRGPAARHRSAERAVHTKGRAGLRRAARKAACTRARHRRAR